MRARLEDRNKAIELRKQGMSYKQIQKQIIVSKSLLSRWFKYLRLSPEEENLLKIRIQERKDQGNLRAMFSNRIRRMERERKVLEYAKETFSKYKEDRFFLTGVALYWAEGSKRVDSFQFINSDPDMIKLMYIWIQKFMAINRQKIKCRLFIHKIPGYEGIESFWSKNLGIEPLIFQKTIYKKTQYAIKKNPDYKGCLRLTINGIFYLRLVKAWQKLLLEYHDVDMRP